MIIDVLSALAVVGAVALVSGGVLAVASHFFEVKEDETALKIRECLPGINCGACGYNGCDEYAKAVSQNGAKTNLCIPGADTVAAQVAAVVGEKAQDVTEMAAYVSCNGNCKATKKVTEYEGITSCAALSKLYGGNNACNYGCLGLGDCANVCPVGAICLKDGIAHVDYRVCVGCGMCIKTCPKNLIRFVPLASPVAIMCSNREKGAVALKKCKNACIACKKCENTCPSGAIKVIDNLAQIDYGKCIACLKCAEVCPTGVIKTKETYAKI